MYMTKSAAACALSAAMVVLMTLPAQANEVQRGVSVRFADLNLSRTSDAERLYDRIKTAAIQTCSPFDSSNVFEQARMSDCVRDAITRAVAKISRRTLHDVYLARRGSAPPPPLVAMQGQ